MSMTALRVVPLSGSAVPVTETVVSAWLAGNQAVKA